MQFSKCYDGEADEYTGVSFVPIISNIRDGGHIFFGTIYFDKL